MRITVSVPVMRPLVLAGVAVAFASIASAQQQFVSIAGAPCAAPPVLHCPDAPACDAAILRLRQASAIYEAVEPDGRKQRAAM